MEVDVEGVDENRPEERPIFVAQSRWMHDCASLCHGWRINVVPRKSSDENVAIALLPS